MVITKIFYGNRETHRFKDEKGNSIPFSRLLRNGPTAFYSFLGRKFFHVRPQVPWISYDARLLLARLLPREAAVLEFGSGNSTLWYARHFQTVFSVEDNAEWHGCVRLMLAKAGLNNVHYFLHDETAYAQFAEITDQKFDFAMIDGSNRSACVQTALKRVKPDAILYLDNSDKHPQGGDTRLAEESLFVVARERGGRVLYFTDFAPTDLFGNQGMMVLLGRYADAV